MAATDTLGSRPSWASVFVAGACLCFLAGVPSVMQSGWSFVDEPSTQARAMAVSLEDLPGLFRGLGSVRPLYWLYCALTCRWLGDARPYHYAFQVVFLLCSYLLFLIAVKKATKGRLSWPRALLCVCFPVLSPMAETWYTLFKAEIPLVLLICSTLAVVSCQAMTRRGGSLAGWGLAFVCVAASAGTKEIGFAGAALLVALGVIRDVHLKTWKNTAASLALSVSILLGIHILPRLLFGFKAAYTDDALMLNPVSIAYNTGTYAIEFPEIVLLGMVSAAVLSLELFRRRWRETTVILAVSCWTAGAGAFLLLIVWKWPGGYYLIPTSIFWLFALIVLLPDTAGVFWRGLVAIGVTAFAVVNVLSFGDTAFRQFQLTAQGYSALLAYTQAASPGSRLFCPEYTDKSEQVGQAETIVRNLVAEKVLGVVPASMLFGLSDYDKDTPKPPVAGDFLFVRRYVNTGRKAVRGLETYNNESVVGRLRMLHASLDPVYSNQVSFRSLNPTVGFLKPTTMAVAVYRFEAPASVALGGVGGLWRLDGWTGQRLPLLLPDKTQVESVRLVGHCPRHDMLPMTIIARDGERLLNEYVVRDDRRFTFDIPVGRVTQSGGCVIMIEADRSKASEALGLRPKRQELSWVLDEVVPAMKP